MAAAIIIGSIIAIVCGKYLLTFITIYKNSVSPQKPG